VPAGNTGRGNGTSGSRWSRTTGTIKPEGRLTLLTALMGWTTLIMIQPSNAATYALMDNCRSMFGTSTPIITTLSYDNIALAQPGT
jgi:hypothetical protein